MQRIKLNNHFITCFALIPFVLWFLGFLTFEITILSCIGAIVFFALALSTAHAGIMSRWIAGICIIIIAVYLGFEGVHNDMFQSLYPAFISIFVIYYSILNIIQWKITQ